VAKVKNDASDRHCLGGNGACDQSGVDLGGAARTNATISTVALAAGGGLLATGIVLYLAAGRRPASNASGAPRLLASVGASGPRLGLEASW
jgi:hypothetical protein